MDERTGSASYWAVATRGLEEVASNEIQAGVPDAHALDTTYRRVAFSSTAHPSALLALRTVEDLFVDIETWAGIGRPRAALAQLQEYAMALDLRDAAALCREARELGAPPTFSVTVNFVGRRNYSTDEIKSALAGSVEATHRWIYRERDIDADLNLRVFLEHEQAYLGVRLAARPLNERPYKIANVPGSLKPNVAAAMVRLGRFEPGATIADPLCGAGTIVIEAALAGLQAIGGDSDMAALEAAKRNLEAAGVDVTPERWDARALPLVDGSLDGVICNLPWGRQVEMGSEIESFYARSLREMRRVCRQDGTLVLLTSLQPLLRSTARAAGFEVESETEISLSGQTPTLSMLRSAA